MGEWRRPVTVLIIFTWFLLNIVINNLNGWILKTHGFAYPVTLTTVHMICCWALSGGCLLSVMRPTDPQPTSAATLRKVRMLSLAFCASVACGNIALRYIFVSFSQMVSAASPLFTMLLSAAMVGKRFSRTAYLSTIPMCGGVMLCTAGEVNFHVLGFLAILASTLLRGIKSILQARLLSPEERMDALTLLYHMSRASIAPLGLYAALGEYPALNDPHLASADSFRLWLLILTSGLISFLLNVCNFLVTKETSAVTLQVLGNVKVVFAIAVSLFIFGNRVSSWSVVGCAVTLLGVGIYDRGK